MIPNGEAGIIAYFGNPSKKYKGRSVASSEWERDNIVRIDLPFLMSLAWAPGSVIDTVRLHKKVADDFSRRMRLVWEHARLHIKHTEGYDHTTQFYDQKAHEWLHSQGLTLWGGGYNWRQKRSSDELSVHSFGAAFDLDPSHNAMGTDGRMPAWFVKIWTAKTKDGDGWIWGGTFHDPMHFQFCTGY